MQNYCCYYQATSEPKNHLFLVGILKSYEYICFDRTLDPALGIFEFFVPADQEALFVHIMERFLKMGIISSMEKLPNRLIDEPL
jgi:hypothetical protein